MARPEYREWNPELIKPKKLPNPVKASRSHQELHRELLMNHRRWERRSAASAWEAPQAAGAWGGAPCGRQSWRSVILGTLEAEEG